MFPRLHPLRPTLRVPVVLWPPLVQAEDPAVAENLQTCVGRALPCYKYTNGENITSRTKQLLCCYGASIDFLKFLQRDLGFDTEIYITPDGEYGKLDNVNGTWNGIINELISGNADLALDLAGSLERAKAVDMLYPCIASAMNILVQKQQNYGEQGLCIRIQQFRLRVTHQNKRNYSGHSPGTQTKQRRNQNSKKI